jgi:hypothetical protein
MQILVLLGIFLFPIFTLGCVLNHYGHDTLGFIAIIVSIFFSECNTLEQVEKIIKLIKKK